MKVETENNLIISAKLTMQTQDWGVEGGRCRKTELDDVVSGPG
jgi:hypothetical protein